MDQELKIQPFGKFSIFFRILLKIKFKTKQEWNVTAATAITMMAMVWMKFLIQLSIQYYFQKFIFFRSTTTSTGRARASWTRRTGTASTWRTRTSSSGTRGWTSPRERSIETNDWEYLAKGFAKQQVWTKQIISVMYNVNHDNHCQLNNPNLNYFYTLIIPKCLTCLFNNFKPKVIFHSQFYIFKINFTLFLIYILF